jgi:phosphinothricin acetyltransferase
MSEIVIRRAQPGDLPALLAIYNHYIATTPITFDIAPRTLAQRREWFDQFSNAGRYQCFAAISGDEPVGWSCSARLKEKEAYATSIETSVYCAPGQTGKGLGRRLYATLFEALAGEDIHRAHAGITLPNDASVALHKAAGFRLIGTQSEVGRKFGKFWDVALYEREM